ncbi:polymorphic toxin type 44 domain-containing protein [Pedobacter sp. MC2016-24]|uniref:polymorphic toxin type 44 domain-containing protein n=1 Tax=Pedobacter sp. MC2016-24 TaxID=2780090 RepID=UPI0018802E79|nr:polymorphic toxin type 44 domain-containing protein [Pedobacter sp. MC2016-24]MBE9599486.1 hypothetical protein [Pedobacter sp. MC2016-24]
MGPESVHIDEFGKVLGNYEDGDNGVYVHQGANSSKDYKKDYDSKTNTAAGGKKIGELGGTIDVNEIYKNLVDKNARESADLNILQFREKVRGRGDWDLKNDKESIFGLGNDGKTSFKFEANIMEAQDIGNHHFGVVGKANHTFTEEFMLEQAGAAQMAAGTSKPEWQKQQRRVIVGGSGTPTTIIVMFPPYGDDPRDQKWIKAGFKYYERK